MENFTPIKQDIPEKRPYVQNFRAWFQKSLPAVYDDSLSYIEMLSKVIDFLNSVINSTNGITKDFNKLIGLYNQLVDFVNNYFKNLDIQDEINNALDDMAQDGTLAEIVNQFVLGWFTTIELHGGVGDGVTDDSAAFDEALETGMTVVVLKKYLINTPPKSDKVRMAGSGTILFGGEFYMFNNDYQDMVIEGPTFDGQGKGCGLLNPENACDYIEYTNVEVKNCKRPDLSDIGYLPGHHAMCIAAKTAKVSACNVHDNQTHGIVPYINSKVIPELIDIDGCIVNNNYVEISGSPSGIGISSYYASDSGSYKGELAGTLNISNCYASGNGDSGVAINGFEFGTITGCVSRNNYEHGFVVQQCRGASVTGNTAQNNQSYSIRIQGDYSVPAENMMCENTVVSGNTFIGERGIYYGAGATDSFITSNKFSGLITPIYFDIAESRNNTSKNLIVTGNIFQYGERITAGRNFEDLFPYINVSDNMDELGRALPDGFIRYQMKGDGYVYANTLDLSQPITPENMIEQARDFGLSSNPATYESGVLSGASTGAVWIRRFKGEVGKWYTVTLTADPNSTIEPSIVWRNSANEMLILNDGLTTARFVLNVDPSKTFDGFSFTFKCDIAAFTQFDIYLEIVNPNELSVNNVYFYACEGIKLRRV